MGIYDRDYYRRDGPSFLGTITERGRGICFWLIIINIACFILQVATRSEVPGQLPWEHPEWKNPFTDALLLDVDKVMHGEVWRLLTYAFLHSTSSIWHIVFNMLFLFWFGRQVEEHLGSREFLAFYLASAVLGGLVYTAASLAGLHLAARALGASGAVMAVLVLAALYNPRQTILLFFIIPVPIWAFVVFLVVQDAFGLLGRFENNVAVSAHLGGAAFGFAYYTFHWRLTDWLPSFSSMQRRRARPRLRLYQEDDEEPASTHVTARRPAASGSPGDEQLEAQMDAILEKIPRVGMEGLTEHERELLVRASEAIKRRRG
jgi:membrane associated rhomboid family serine protease